MEKTKENIDVSNFDGDISHWDTSRIKKVDILELLKDQKTFKEKISQIPSSFDVNMSTWDLSKVQDMTPLFKKADFSGNLDKLKDVEIKNAEFKDVSFKNNIQALREKFLGNNEKSNKPSNK